MKRNFKRTLITMLLLFHATFSYAHWDAAYFRNTDDGFTDKSDWMKNISNNTKLSELALPGTHDSASFNANKFKNIAMTQVLNINQQLKYGIRVLDLRVRQTSNRFALHHGSLFLNLMFGDVLNGINNFLDKHPSETILIRLKEETKPAADNTQSLRETLKAYLTQYPNLKHYLKASNQVTLGEARGKFIVLSNNYDFHQYGLIYSDFIIQDEYDLKHNWKLYGKWKNVKSQLEKAYLGSKNSFYVNFLSGSGGVFPYFVASGHSSSGTSAPRLATGLTTPGWKSDYPDFPRIDCFIGICTIAFEGINSLTRDELSNINSKRIYFNDSSMGFIIPSTAISIGLNLFSSKTRTVGIIMADFPGESLISEIIKNNYFYMINKPKLAPINIEKLKKINNASVEAFKKMKKEDPILYANFLKSAQPSILRH